MLRNAKGFTLIELMVVVVIIGILAAIALPNFMAMQDRAKESEVKANAHTLQLSVEDYKTQNNGAKPTAFLNAPQPASAAASTAYVPSTMKNPFAVTITGSSIINVTTVGTAQTGGAATTPAASGKTAGNLGYDQAASQLTAYFIAGWGKSGNVITALSEGQ